MQYHYTRVRHLIETRGVTLAYICRRVGKSSETLYRWMDGRTEPKASDLGLLAAVFEVDVNYFYRSVVELAP